MRLGRLHPLERAAAAAAQRGQLAVEGFDDAADALLIGVLDGLPVLPASRVAYMAQSSLSCCSCCDCPGWKGSLGTVAGAWCVAVQCSDGAN